MSNLSGPLFEPAITDHWTSVHKKNGAHYNTYKVAKDSGMAALRDFFPEGEANELNAALFSTSGIHGTYCTIEEIEADLGKGDDGIHDVTFLIVQPRLVCLRYGECTPVTADDFAFLKRLRDSSGKALAKIGHPEEPKP